MDKIFSSKILILIFIALRENNLKRSSEELIASKSKDNPNFSSQNFE